MQGFGAALAMFLAAGPATAGEYEIANRPDVVFAEHDGAKLAGDFYRPKGLAKAPVLVAIHGGGWRAGTRAFYRYWGLFLARAGYAVFAIDYRLGKPGRYPAAVYDAKAAVQFMRAHAAEFDIDPDRIGLMGDSAGGYLAAMLALAGDRFTKAYQGDFNPAVSSTVKAVVGFYGIYDMMAQWKQDMTVSPGDSITEDFLGVSPAQDRQLYLEASPISYVKADRKDVRFLLIHGENDKLVDLASQSGAFAAALTQAGFFASLVTVPGAGHFWATQPFEADPHSYSVQVIPPLMRFLESWL